MFWKLCVGFLVLAAFIWSSIGLLTLAAGALCGLVKTDDAFLRWQLRFISAAKKTPVRFILGRFMEREEQFIARHFANARPVRQ